MIVKLEAKRFIAALDHPDPVYVAIKALNFMQQDKIDEAIVWADSVLTDDQADLFKRFLVGLVDYALDGYPINLIDNLSKMGQPEQ